MALVAVTYTYNGDTETMDEVRPSHREFLYGNTGVVASGPTGDSEGALIIVEGEPDEVELWLDNDPFWTAGVITDRTVVAWNFVGGSWRDQLA